MWNKTKLDAWAEHIKAGGVGAAPAEGVYGYVADPFQENAVRKIIATKQRDENKGLILLVRDISFIPQLTGDLPPVCQAAVDRYFPCPQEKPITLILPHNFRQNSAFSAPHAMLLSGGRDTLAIRVSACPYVQEYMQHTNGFLVSTSLNQSGEPAVFKDDDIPPSIQEHTLILGSDYSIKQKLEGVSSRIYNPTDDTWLR